MELLKPITVLVTAAGCPGASTCIRYLKTVRERDVRVIGIDASSECVGRFLCDDFLQVPAAKHPDYITTVLDYCLEQKVDCILVSSSYEIEELARNSRHFSDKGISLLASSADSLKMANNKQFLYETCRDIPGIKVPEFTVVNTLEQFVDACAIMGYPDRNLCFKPPFSKGSRGFRYLNEKISRADLLLNFKPDNKIITMDEMKSIFENESQFPDLLIMETVEGEEIDSMVLALDGDALLITHKTREKERGGVITLGGHCERPELDTAIQSILEAIPLSYNVGIQFKGGYLMEINPRLSTFLYTEDWVEPYFAIKLALGEFSPEDVRSLQSKVPHQLRMVRYFDQLFWMDNHKQAEDQSTI